jgi:hypothetical protein
MSLNNPLQVANNLTETVVGKVLDATQGTALSTSISQLAAQWKTVVKLTAAQYAALVTKDATTLYIIVEA